MLALVGCGHDTRPRSVGPTGSSASSSASSAASTTPSPGAAGIGDPYFADLGNGGYDVTHYDLSFTSLPSTNAFDGTAVITATATQALSQFDLDLTGLEVTGVIVDGQTAASSRSDRELVIVPARPIAAGATFTTTIAYHGSPEPRTTKSLPIAVGWIATGDGSYVLNEPEGASTWYPVNDHPIDKATYTFHITVPDGVTAVANGTLVSQVANGDGHTTWTYDEKQPMASYLSQVAIGDYKVTTEPGPNGVTIRNVFESSLAKDATIDFSRTADMLQLFATDFGPYPFDVYGALVVNDRTNYELETQTLSLFDSRFASGSTNGDGLAAHELAHQWFGDSVTPSTWKDIWLNEGFATYAEWLWQEHVGGISVADSAKRMHDSLPPSSEVLTGDPAVEHLFDTRAVYQRGGVALQALRLTVGDEAFFTILRTYTSRFAGRNATTADFIAIANSVSGRDLHDLFDAWLYRAELPALPS